jgi:[ribosomal protein S5]-alanine N-acetyltransferase
VPYPVTLATPRLTLREFTGTDLGALHTVYGDPATTQHLSFEPRSREQVAAILDRVQDAACAVPRADYTALASTGPSPSGSWTQRSS